ncbi:hypothetical protein [Mangrovimonas sp. YM274]|uniref:hypothetical protein n=1 Tax=Mangrovimonas sp. YM274 TaxID=3070660 RepID=UPI0027DABA9E|nr:hypothetical protein [Mangrovimonas sp. YM274]WMI69167.1 hypothetical protein RBH95_02060 [Mangrovimonas sp. YM274]
MKQTKSILALILLNLGLFSCTTEDSTNTLDPNPSTVKLVKTEEISETKKIDYLYQDDGLLAGITGIYNSYGYSQGLTYDTADRLTQWTHQETGASSYSDTANFTYNANGQLVGYVSNNEDVTLSYEGTTVTMEGTIEGDANALLVLELDSNGRVVTLTESYQYTNFSYDANGNMVSAQSFDTSNNPLMEFTIGYDDKINPFYGQLESIYLERFVEFFWEFEGIFISGFGGYNFPFLQNNITSVTQVGGNTETRTYTYDASGYPIQVNEGNLEDSLPYSITYY